MSDLSVVAVTSELVNKVRATMLSPGYGHPVTVEIARGHGPCRHCLRPFRVGEECRLLFTFNAFEGVAPLAQPGPVFVHQDACEQYPEDAGYPTALLGFATVLDAYDGDQMVRRRERVIDGVQATALHNILSDPTIQYVMVRDANAGCYDFRVERRRAV